MKCPECKNVFSEFLQLKNKVLYLCRTCGIFSYVDGLIDYAKYPCPKCKKYYYPIGHKDHHAICKCEEHGLWYVNFLKSFSFRRICSETGKKHNISPTHYSKPEIKVKRILDNLGYRENRDYYHNKKVRAYKGVCYYPDFIIERDDMKKIIEVSPVIWHKKDDSNKANYFTDRGYDYIVLSDRTTFNWEDIVRNELL